MGILVEHSVSYIAIILIAAAVLFGCGKPGHPDQVTLTPTEELAAQYDLYKQIAPKGWAVSKECDALLFTSLQRIGTIDASGDGGAIEQAMGSPGQWFRLPSLVNDRTVCSSDISRDMFMGLLSYIYEFKRLDLAEQIWEYGEKNSWKMGEERKEGLQNRVQFMPSTIGLLAQVIYALGGEDHAERYYSQIESYSTQPGYVSHLTLLHIRLVGKINGEISDGELEVLRKILKHMQQNPLAHALYHKYTDGDQTEATRLLLSIWPKDRLPTGADWHEEWRTQRSDGDSGLLPSNTKASTVHSGGDFLFAAAIILGYI